MTTQDLYAVVMEEKVIEKVAEKKYLVKVKKNGSGSFDHWEEPGLTEDELCEKAVGMTGLPDR